ncbi:MAG: nicotinamide mononucleotide transporter [Saprospiraceae bacterium]|nr:MAG: nicotinamide mononucleotide transporter [Saprospiraceae bacterium]
METIDFSTELARQLQSMSWMDWVATLTALIYVVLAARENNWCWLFGIISCSLWAYVTFAFYQLYLDAILQLFYVIMSFVGLYRWKYGGQANSALPISRLSGQAHLLWAITGLILSLGFGYFFAAYTSAAATYLDALTTVFSVIATFLLIQKRLDNWLYWVLIDALYAYLYFSRGALLFGLLMVIYVIIASVALYNWIQIYKQEKQLLDANYLE